MRRECGVIDRRAKESCTGSDLLGSYSKEFGGREHVASNFACTLYSPSGRVIASTGANRVAPKLR
jgi:hypothetical protein